MPQNKMDWMNRPLHLADAQEVGDDIFNKGKAAFRSGAGGAQKVVGNVLKGLGATDMGASFVSSGVNTQGGESLYPPTMGLGQPGPGGIVPTTGEKPPTPPVTPGPSTPQAVMPEWPTQPAAMNAWNTPAGQPLSQALMGGSTISKPIAPPVSTSLVTHPVATALQKLQRDADGITTADQFRQYREQHQGQYGSPTASVPQGAGMMLLGGNVPATASPHAIAFGEPGVPVAPHKQPRPVSQHGLDHGGNKSLATVMGNLAPGIAASGHDKAATLEAQAKYYSGLNASRLGAAETAAGAKKGFSFTPTPTDLDNAGYSQDLFTGAVIPVPRVPSPTLTEVGVAHAPDGAWIVRTKEDLDKVPSGQVIIAPDGSRKLKP